MLYRDLMPRAHNAPFEKRECGFDCIRGDGQAAFISDVLCSSMIDALVCCLVVRRGGEVVELRFIGHDDIESLVNVAFDNLVDLFLIQGTIGLDEVEVSSA